MGEDETCVERSTDELGNSSSDGGALSPPVADTRRDDDEAGDDDDVDKDPYLLAEAKYIQSDPKWKNKQRTLILGSRGISHRYRHLMEDFRRMMPHHKSEPKIERKLPLSEVVSLSVERSCNNIFYFDSRKRNRFLYLWIVRAPHGPSFKFQVRNVHTSGEVKMAGNFLLHSRPLLSFDSNFSSPQAPHLGLFREMITQSLGTPRNHPKAKPFYDHVISFAWLHGSIWIRQYQIHPKTEEDYGSAEQVELTESGPRLALQPIRAFQGAFGGHTLYLNKAYATPTAMSVASRKRLKKHVMTKLRNKLAREQHFHENYTPESPYALRNLFKESQMDVFEDEGEGEE